MCRRLAPSPLSLHKLVLVVWQCLPHVDAKNPRPSFLTFPACTNVPSHYMRVPSGPESARGQGAVRSPLASGHFSLLQVASANDVLLQMAVGGRLELSEVP